jgi:thiamine biosynthesis lipoprotein
MEHTAQHRVLHAMGMPIHLTLLCEEDAADGLAERAQREFDRWDRRFSRFKESSELAILNQHAGSWVSVNKEMFSVISECKKLAEQTAGLFDPSAGSYLAAAGYGLPADYSLPEPAPTYARIELDTENCKIRCAPDQILEPAAIVKGMAIDAVGAMLSNCPAWMINAGGDILTHGAYGQQEFWNVAIQDPFDRFRTVTAISVRDCAVATSGDYETTWVKDGKPRHHQIDMRTGQPTEAIRSVTVVADTAKRADTFSSLLFLGVSPESLHMENVGYFIINVEGIQYRTKEFAHLEDRFRDIITT